MASLSDFTLADPRANQVLQKLREEIGVTTPFRYLGKPVAINFPTANVAVEIQHQLQEVPDGYHVVNADCGVKRAPGRLWTKELAFLMSDTNNSSVILAFGVLREAVTSVNAT